MELLGLIGEKEDHAVHGLVHPMKTRVLTYGSWIGTGIIT